MRAVDPIANLVRCLMPVRTFSIIEEYLELLEDLKINGHSSQYARSIRLIIASFLYAFFRLPLSLMIAKNDGFLQILFGDYSNIVETTDRTIYFYAYECYNLCGFLFMMTCWYEAHPNWYRDLAAISTTMLPRPDFRKYSARYLLIFSMLAILNSFQFFTLSLYTWMLCVLYRVVLSVIENWEIIEKYLYVPLLIIAFHYMNQLFNCVAYLFHSQMMGGLIWWKLFAMYINHVQNIESLKKSRTEKTIRRSMIQCGKIFVLLFRDNVVFSGFFTVYMALLLPFSAYANIVIVMRSLHFYHLVIFITSSHFFLAICFVHFGMAAIMKKVHSPGKLIHQRIVRWPDLCQGRLRLAHRLRMMMFAERFHTRKKYGYMYWKSGNMSLGSFSKCCLIYSEVMMWSYKIIRGIN